MQNYLRPNVPPVPQNNLLKIIGRYWSSIIAVLTFALSIGFAQGKYAGVEARVDAIEQTHPDTIADRTTRNSGELAAFRLQIDRIQHDVYATRVDVARICTQLGLRPSKTDDQPDGE